jgi:hypothetical protein
VTALQSQAANLGGDKYKSEGEETILPKRESKATTRKKLVKDPNAPGSITSQPQYNVYPTPAQAPTGPGQSADTQR